MTQENTPQQPRVRPAARCRVYEAKNGEWRWRMVAVNGRTVADSAEGYDSKQGAVEAAYRLRDYALSVNVDDWVILPTKQGADESIMAKGRRQVSPSPDLTIQHHEEGHTYTEVPEHDQSYSAGVWYPSEPPRDYGTSDHPTTQEEAEQTPRGPAPTHDDPEEHQGTHPPG